MKVVVSQPMFFPWIGLFEQIQLADTYVHLDDVQMPGGSSFMHRVQLKGASGAFWWSLPLKKRSISALISDVEIAPSQKWIQKSQHSLEQILSGLPFRNESIDIFLEVIEKNFNTLSQFNKYSIELISKYL